MPRLPSFAACSVLCSLGLLLCVASADAQVDRPAGQRPGQQRPNQRPGVPGPQVPREDVRFSGQLKAMQGGLLQVVNEEGGQWIVKPPDRGQGVSVVGSATREWLERGGARGLSVRFVGTFDKSGAPQAPINQLFVFTPRQWGGNRDDDYKVGVYPEGASGELKGLFGEDGQPKTQPQVMDFRVVGTLAGVGKGAVSVAAGGARVSAKLADDASISVNLGDLRYAQPGDKIEVDGWHVKGQPGQVYANRITITSATPLGTAPPEQEKGKPEKEK